MNVAENFVRLFGERGITILIGCVTLAAIIVILIAGVRNVSLENWG